MQCTGSKRCKEFHAAFLLSILITCNPRFAALAKFSAAYHSQAVSHDLQVSPWTGADISACIVTACRWLLLLVAINYVLPTPTNCLSSNTYIYSCATMIIGLWAGVLERPSSQPPRPWSVPWVIAPAAQGCCLFSFHWFVTLPRAPLWHFSVESCVFEITVFIIINW